MEYIDTHAHLNLEAFAADAEGVANACGEQSVGVINIGTGEATSARAVALAEQFSHCYAIVGLHPIHAVDSPTGEWSAETFHPEYYRQYKDHPKVVGVGECGFDYFYTPPDSYAVQKAAFIAQVELANELNLPLMIHTRGPKPGTESPTGRSVYEDVYETLKRHARVPGNIHFYAGTYEEAAKFIDLGFTISFTGVITFARAYDEVIKNVPLTALQAETDCPYVAPVPYRGQRCEPWMVKEVYQAIARIRNESEAVVKRQLLENAQTLWKLPDKVVTPD